MRYKEVANFLFNVHGVDKSNNPKKVWERVKILIDLLSGVRSVNDLNAVFINNHEEVA